MDWEKIITAEDRNLDYLKDTVTRIVNSICNALEEVKYHYENLDTELCREVSFITSQELEDMYPDLTPKERENAYAREKKTIFIMQIGDLLKSGEKHDGRAPDYDDWKLNGDLLFWHELCSVPWRFHPWESVWMPKPSVNSLIKPDAMSAGT